VRLVRALLGSLFAVGLLAGSATAYAAERDDAKAELKRTQVALQKKQHEAQAMSDAITDKDRRIAMLTQQIEELKAAEELQKAVEQVEEFKDKKNSEISSLRQQIIDLQRRASEYDELRKAHIVLQQDNENLQKNIEQLELTAKQNAEVQNRRSIETGNTIDGLKAQLAAATALAEDFKRKYNSLSVDGNEKAANFARNSAERDDAKAELQRTKVTLQKKQHEVQAMKDAMDEKDRQIAALKQQLAEAEKAKAAPAAAPAAVIDEPIAQDDPTLRAIDDIDWEDDGSLPPHPGEDPRQLSLF
jgi:chromosome segregation ATPase